MLLGNLLAVMVILLQIGDYPIGTVVEVTATPNPECVFSGWSGDVNSPENPLVLTLDADKSLVPNYTCSVATVTLSVSPSPEGTTSVVVIPLPPDPPVCGNSVVEVGEQCDDGNVVNGDGCSAICQTEAPPPPTGQPGWEELPNTKIRPVCPPADFGGTAYNFAFKCVGVTAAWSGAVLDTQRNRLIVWGGGHTDYLGNELYSLNLVGTPTVVRLNDPGLPLAIAAEEAIAGGTQANARHSYDGIAYISGLDKMFVFGGALAGPQGNYSNASWFFNFSTQSWEQLSPSGIKPAAVQPVAAFDEISGDVFLEDGNFLYRYSIALNSFSKLSVSQGSINRGFTGTIDPALRRFVLLGNGQSWFHDLVGPNFDRQALVTTGGSAVIAAPYPGVAFHPPTGHLVAWVGGDTVYELDQATGIWIQHIFSNGPTAIASGTFGRWQYAPSLNAFVTLNSVDANAFLFRLP